MIGTVFFVLAVAAVASGSPVPDEFLERGGRIVGGQDAALGRFPWAVTLRRRAEGTHFCGGSIINNRWVLSAAHCTEDRGPSDVRVIVGTVIRTGAGGVNHGVSRIINHPNWRRPGFVGHDVCVIQTAATIAFNTNVRSIDLGSAFVGAGVNAIAIGFGRLRTGGAQPERLQWVTLTTITNAQCGARGQDQIWLCTSVPAGRGTCNGDSGGSLSSAGLVIGIVSWGTGGECGNGLPDGFTRVSAVRSWILNNAR